MQQIRAVDAPVRPIYGPGWRSGITLGTVVYPVSFVLLRSLLWRLLVRLRLPATAAYDVDAFSVRGPVDVRVRRESGSPHRVMVRTTDGPVTVTN